MSGHMGVLPIMKSWCTPYTLSVAGNEISTGNMRPGPLNTTVWLMFDLKMSDKT